MWASAAAFGFGIPSIFPRCTLTGGRGLAGKRVRFRFRHAFPLPSLMPLRTGAAAFGFGTLPSSLARVPASAAAGYVLFAVPAANRLNRLRWADVAAGAQAFPENRRVRPCGQAQMFSASAHSPHPSLAFLRAQPPVMSCSRFRRQTRLNRLRWADVAARAREPSPENRRAYMRRWYKSSGSETPGVTVRARVVAASAPRQMPRLPPAARRRRRSSLLRRKRRFASSFAASFASGRSGGRSRFFSQKPASAPPPHDAAAGAIARRLSRIARRTVLPCRRLYRPLVVFFPHSARRPFLLPECSLKDLNGARRERGRAPGADAASGDAALPWARSAAQDGGDAACLRQRTLRKARVRVRVQKGLTRARLFVCK